MIKKFIEQIPKAELHLHIEGTFEPELMFEIAARNQIELKYKSVVDLKTAYQFSNLQDFLNIYYSGANVLITEKDFYDLTYAYFKKIDSQNVVHAEIFFDPQTHTNRGIKFDTVINGIHNAQVDAKNDFGISSHLIMSFLRDLDVTSAMETLEYGLQYKEWIIGVGLDSAEVGNPPSKFKEVFDRASSEGFLTVAHAGEEGPAEYVWDALRSLKVSRIDHGNNSLNDAELVNKLVDLQMPLTVCPLSNLKLKVVDDLKNHPLKRMLELGLKATINSDDPAYFGGYINDNFLKIALALNLSTEEIFTLVKNSFHASFLTESEKEFYYSKLNEFGNYPKPE